MLTEYTFHSIPIIYIYVVICLILPRIPVIGKFFNIINTALHELGHAIITLILGGKVTNISLKNDASGTTSATGLKTKFANFFVAIAGYPFAASIAWFAFYLISIKAFTALLLTLSAIFVIMLLFWIRNLYGVIWTFLFCGLNIALLYFNNTKIIFLVSLFYATMILTEAVISTFIQLKIILTGSDSSCDAVVLSRITHIPALIWGLLFASYSCFVAYKIVVMFFML